MFDPPPCAALAALTEPANAVIPTSVVGFARICDEGRVSVLFAHANRIAEYRPKVSELVEALLPGPSHSREADPDVIQAHPDRAIEWQLIAMGARRVLAFPLPDVEPRTRFWVGFSEERAPTFEQYRALEALAVTSAKVVNRSAASKGAEARLHRLELAASLLPALGQVLDVREIFDRLSGISQAALRHDMLTLGLFSEDLATLTLYARTGESSDLGRVFPQPYPRAVTEAWQFDIIDDRTNYPLERDRPPTTLGMRSSLRIPFRFDGRTVGGLGFHSRDAATYGSDDVPIARRLADYVALALYHHRLAQELAAQNLRNEELRARTTNLELLDELLIALIDSGDLPDVFGRISAIAAKVLPHDAAALLVCLPDGLHGRLYASSGFPDPLPEIQEIPEDVLQNPDWDHHILDDMTKETEPRYARLVNMGFRSRLRVVVRLDGKFAGALAFMSKAYAAFNPADVLIARRMSDRIAVKLARDRAVEASRRADDAAARAAQLEARVRALTEELDARTGYRRVVGESREWHQVLTQAAQVAATDTTVLLLGESGTGKEVVARFLHRGSSRKAGPFVALNCAALPEQLLEAELFGFERGAYTGATHSKPGQLEQAAGGTLFLDEVAEMSPSAQAKFLRVLQEREFQRLGGTRVLRTDARVVAATNRDLLRGIANGQFREDLYYRLNVFAIRLPPLRERRDDILPLSEAFLAEIGRGLGRPPGGISREARGLLVDYRWPGNVRELRNILERAAILCDGGLITPEHLAFTIPPPSVVPPSPEPAAHTAPAGPASPTLAGNLQTMERAIIEQALQGARFNKSKAAKTLGLSRHQLYLRMQKYGLE
jgi:transcriptional regulator with GAF, ATPase, and Fis domain